MKSEQPFEPGRRNEFTRVGTPDIQSKNTVLCAINDNRGSLWFGNRDGTLTSYNEATKQFRLHFLQDRGKVNTVSIWALYWDTNRNLWVGTNDGVWKLNIDSGFCKKSLLRFCLRTLLLFVYELLPARRTELYG